MAQVAEVVPLDLILASILDLDLEHDALSRRNVAADTLRFVQKPWIRLLTHVYVHSQEPAISEQLKQSRRIFAPSTDADRFLQEGGGGSKNKQKAGRYLINEFADIVELLVARLEQLDASSLQGSPDMLKGLADDVGNDIESHFHCVEEIAEACTHLFCQNSAIWKHFYSRLDDASANATLSSAATAIQFAGIVSSPTKGGARDGEDSMQMGLTSASVLRQASRLNDAFVRLYSVLNGNATIETKMRAIEATGSSSRDLRPALQRLLPNSNARTHSTAPPISVASTSNKVHPDPEASSSAQIRDQASLTSAALEEEEDTICDRPPASANDNGVALAGAEEAGSAAVHTPLQKQLLPLDPIVSRAGKPHAGGGMFGFSAMNSALNTLLKAFSHHEIGTLNIEVLSLSFPPFYSCSACDLLISQFHFTRMLMELRHVDTWYPQLVQASGGDEASNTPSCDDAATQSSLEHRYQHGWPKFVNIVAHVLSPPVLESSGQRRPEDISEEDLSDPEKGERESLEMLCGDYKR